MAPSVVFGGLALLVAAVGLYSVIAYDVARRRHDLGIRIALGARTRQVTLDVVSGTAVFAAIGIMLGGMITVSSRTRSPTVVRSWAFGSHLAHAHPT